MTTVYSNKCSVAVCHPRLMRGGSEACAMWSIMALKDEYDVSLVTGGEVDLESLNAFYGTSLKPRDFSVIGAPVPLWLRLLRRTGKGDALDGIPYARLCRQIAGRFDVLISAYNLCDFGVPAIQFVADFSWDDALRRQYDSSPGQSRMLYGDNLFRRAYLGLSRALSRPSGRDVLRDDVIIANSRWTAAVMKNKYGCDPAVMYPEVAFDCGNIPWEEKRENFVCIGRIDPAKRIERMIRIVERVRERGYPVQLNIAGRVGDNAYGRKIAAMAEERHAWVVLHGLVWGEKKKALLSSCRYGIQAREAEPFGISVAEMVKAGCIPFVPKEGGQAEIVNHPLLTYENEADAVEKIVSVLETPTHQGMLREHLTAQGRHFSAEAFMTGLRETVARFVGNDGKRRQVQDHCNRLCHRHEVVERMHMTRTNVCTDIRRLRRLRAICAKVTRDWLPHSLRNRIERSHYRRLVSTFRMDREPDLAIVKSLVSQGDVVVDVGANVGVYTKFLSSFVGPSGVVISIEPIPRTFSFLATNVRLLGLRNVVTLQAAISSEPGCVIMEVPRDERGVENHYLARVIGSDGTSYERGTAVPATTIDSVLDGRSGRVSLIKIDTEGHELPCIQGAMRTLARFRPALLIEIGGDMDSNDSDGTELVRILKDLEYDVYVHHHQSVSPRRVGERAANYFFLTSAQQHTLCTHLLV